MRKGFGESTATDVRHAVRGWLKAPVLAVTIVLTVGLGIGASTAMLAIVRTVLLDAIPYDGGDRLVRVYHALSGNRWNLSVMDYLTLEEQQTRFEGVAAFTTSERTLTLGEVVERVPVRAVTAGWFDLLGMQAAHGRMFQPVDGRPGAPPTALVSHGFWRQHFEGDPAAPGRTLRLDGVDYTVVGVLEPDVGPIEERFQIFPVLQFEPPTRRGPFFLTVVGRIQAGTAPTVAAEELRAIVRNTWPDATSTWGIEPLADAVVGRFRTTLLVLLGAVALLLVVASTNAAGLLTARALQRRTELATRAALGASRPRLVRLLVTESVVLALAGCALGLGLAWSALRAVRAAGPDLIPRAGFLVMDGPVLAVAAALTCASLLLFGVIPALQWIGPGSGTAHALRSGGRNATASASAHRMRRALVAAQFAVAVPLLVGAGLLLNSFLHLQRVDPGFNGEGLLTMRIARPVSTGGDPEYGAFWDRLEERVRALPGVVAAGLNTARPPSETFNINNFDPLDRPTPAGESEPLAVWNTASPGFFEALGVRLVAGRMFDSRDDADLGTTSALVDRQWADAMYPGEDPVGRRLYEGGCRAPECSIVNIVGVVENVRYLGLDDAQQTASMGTVYVPQTQWFASTHYLFVRTAGDPLAHVAAIRAIARELDPEVPVTAIATGADLVADALATPRNLAGVVAAFAAIALLLAMIGIYGVMSFFVHEHRKDIGIRFALGGRRGQVLGLIVGRGMRPVVLGTVVGLVAALAAARLIQRLLFGVSPHDPLTLALVVLAMLGTAAAACLLPALQAASIDPARVLRQD